MDLSKYDNIEVHPCLLLDRKGKPVCNDDPRGENYEQCAETDPRIAVWSAYGHMAGKGVEHLRDFTTKGNALRYSRRLMCQLRRRKMYNHMLDVAFTVEGRWKDWRDIPVHVLVAALQQRVNYLKNNPTECAKAFGYSDSYEVAKKEKV